MTLRSLMSPSLIPHRDEESPSLLCHPRAIRTGPHNPLSAYLLHRPNPHPRLQLRGHGPNHPLMLETFFLLGTTRQSAQGDPEAESRASFEGRARGGPRRPPARRRLADRSLRLPHTLVLEATPQTPPTAKPRGQGRRRPTHQAPQKGARQDRQGGGQGARGLAQVRRTT